MMSHNDKVIPCLTCLWVLLELVRSDMLFTRRFLPLSLSKLFLLPLLSFALLCLLLR